MSGIYRIECDGLSLVAIDIEDRGQVERLWALLSIADGSLTYSDVQSALREFANPSPPIEEPTGLGAVVEDAEGDVFIRRARDWTTTPWVRATSAGFFAWADFNPTRVLSHGYTGEEVS